MIFRTTWNYTYKVPKQCSIISMNFINIRPVTHMQWQVQNFTYKNADIYIYIYIYIIVETYSKGTLYWSDSTEFAHFQCFPQNHGTLIWCYTCFVYSRSLSPCFVYGRWLSPCCLCFWHMLLPYVFLADVICMLMWQLLVVGWCYCHLICFAMIVSQMLLTLWLMAWPFVVIEVINFILWLMEQPSMLVHRTWP